MHHCLVLNVRDATFMKIDSLIKFFGGYTELELEGWRARAIASETTVTLITEVLTREREARAKLEERVFPTPMPRSQEGPPDMKPLGNSVSSWPRIRRELEKRNRVNDNAEVSRETIEKGIRG